ncbi:MerR family transcriptional regulator [Kaistia algarum]|uniref:MerR family transcriptional regulator n=1 Tax=Kaistia algarum TaxID=2083279 RepID=UPI000CE729FA|nr:MerR family transcriptional regulator [Kaistia algarum]MCX5515976.1 MerR family transcriptional regulator [Kaistia algarum]PPE80667.1 MerR family transcriptional regulator [Kaistia algarum]
MRSPAPFLSPSQAARQLGVSPKALRLYEQRGLVTPARTAAGYRAYAPAEINRAAEIVALRRLGLSLAQVARVLGGDAEDLGPALANHQKTLEDRGRELAVTVEKVKRLRADLAQGKAPAAGELSRLLGTPAKAGVALELPWPWGGERFELHDIRALNFIVGPLGSGKTRFAERLAQALPGATLLGLDRAADGGAAARARMEADPSLRSRIDASLTWLVGEGAMRSEALVALLAGLEAAEPTAVVVDMVEQGLDHATQEALVAHLRRRESPARPLFLMTRSSAILDLAAVGADEIILFCPANHSPPTVVAPYPGSPGYEAVATCLASPDVRARTEGVIAWRPRTA